MRLSDECLFGRLGYKAGWSHGLDAAIGFWDILELLYFASVERWWIDLASSQPRIDGLLQTPSIPTDSRGYSIPTTRSPLLTMPSSHLSRQ
jgi:hypothetical protein